MTEQQVMIRTSERSTFKSCRLKWKWSYVDHLKPKRERSALLLGTMVHGALEAWYQPGKKRGVHPAKTFDKLWLEHLKSGGEEIMWDGEISLGDLGHEMLTNYVLMWGKDDHIEVIAPELTFQVDIHHPKSGRYLFTYVGTIDAVIRDLRTGLIGLLEHKTGAGLEPFGAPIHLDEQNGAYWTFAPYYLQEQGILGENEWPDFMLYNRLRKAFADTRPVNEDGHALNKPTKEALVEVCKNMGLDDKGTIPALIDRLRLAGISDRAIELLGKPSLTQPAPLFKRESVPRGPGNRRVIMARAIDEARDMDLARRGKIGIYKNPDKHCGYCEYREMCEIHELGDDWEALRDEMFTTWEPYADHEIQMEGKL